MAGLAGAQSSGNRYADVGDGLFHLVPNEATAAANGFDWNDVSWYGSDDQLPGSIGDPLADVTAQPAAPPPAAPPPPQAPPPARSFKWGKDQNGNDLVWRDGDLAKFIGYLAAHGSDYSSWAANHEAAAALLEGPQQSPQQEALPKSLGEALASWITAGLSAAAAAAQVEALRASLVAQGVSSVTPAQLLADANVIKATYDQAQGQPPPEGEPTVPGGPTVTPPTIRSRDPGARELASASGLPPIPAGFATIVNGKVTEGFVISAALIEHADPWIVLGTTQVESNFNLEEKKNSAGAVGPMQEVGYPTYSSSMSLEQWAWGNLIAGARLLAKYAAVYDDDQAKMSAAYNAGPGAVNTNWPHVLQWQEVVGHPEAGTVQDYVDNVARAAGDYRASFADGWNINPKTGALVGAGGPTVKPPVLDSPGAPPAGVNSAWDNLVTALATASPKAHDQLQSKANQFTEIFK